MAMKQPKPKSKVSGMYDFQNIYTGDPKKSPGVVKAKADRAKSDSAVAAYKKKSDAAKAKAIAVAKMKKKK
jgi:hypothetical protein